MTLEQLRIFVAVATALHVTRAARQLGLTQSAASSAIAALEARYAIKLFHRVGRRIELTEPGRIFLEEAKAVLARAAMAEQALDDLSGLARGALRIHASQTIANYWLPPILFRWHAAHPGITMALAIGNTAQVAAAVLEGSADLGFVEGDIPQTELIRETVATDRLLLVVGATHAWAGRRSVKPRQLLETDWVLREKGSGTRSEFEAALRRYGIASPRLKVALELPSNESVRAAVEAGAGATAISERVVLSGIRAGTLHRIEFPLPQRAFHLLRHRERYQSKAQLALMDFIAAEGRQGPRVPR
jgi:DNA-binding transcriptional LysR family regulator